MFPKDLLPRGFEECPPAEIIQNAALDLLPKEEVLGVQIHMAQCGKCTTLFDECHRGILKEIVKDGVGDQCFTKESFAEFLTKKSDGALDPAVEAGILTHLSHCPGCQQIAEQSIEENVRKIRTNRSRN